MTPPLKPHGGQDASGGAERGDVSQGSREAVTGEPRTWTLTIPAVVPFLNLNQRMHWAPKAELTRKWRQTALMTAQVGGLPKGLAKVHVTAHITKPTRRAFDVHNLIPTLKAIIDGLVDHGLVADDSTKYLTGPDMRVNPDTGPAAVVVTITEMKGTK